MARAESEFADFYRREFGHLVRSLRPVSGEAAEDVAHDAFLIALRDWERVAALELPFAWLLKVARRIAWRRSNREARRSNLETAAVAARPMHAEPNVDVDLTQSLATLSERESMVITLHHLHDEPVELIAERLGCTPSAAKVALHRARTRIAASAVGFSGRWVSERTWTVTDIARYVATIGEPEYIPTVVEEDLHGRGGRWELSVHGGKYALHRDDGLELDRGRFDLGRHRFALRPTRGVGVATFTYGISCERLQIGVVASTEPPHLGVPDEVWASLFYASGRLMYAGPAEHPLVV
jgi:RNA polymerase sigma-70 factor (ECF subfamily)